MPCGGGPTASSEGEGHRTKERDRPPEQEPTFDVTGCCLLAAHLCTLLNVPHFYQRTLTLARGRLSGILVYGNFRWVHQHPLQPKTIVFYHPMVYHIFFVATPKCLGDIVPLRSMSGLWGQSEALYSCTSNHYATLVPKRRLLARKTLVRSCCRQVLR